MAYRFIDSLVRALESAAMYNPEAQSAPACVLWPDGDRQWEAVIPRLQTELPQLLKLGDYTPEKRVGPAIWLRCVIAGKAGEVAVPDGFAPILYLPGVSRQDLRNVESCPQSVRPLIELQYRGVIWVQTNSKDWTILAFLKSNQGGLGLDVAQDNETKNAMQMALCRFLDEDIGVLAGKRLDKDYFNTLLTGGDPVRDVLLWLNDDAAFRSARDEGEWKAFVEVCKSRLAFNPDKEGILSGAAKLAAHKGPWRSVWERYCEAPGRYANVPVQIRKCTPPVFGLFQDLAEVEGWPQWNEDEENSLRTELLGLGGLPAHEARKSIFTLERRHRLRRELVWAELGEAPLALALKHLAVLSEATQDALAAGTAEDLVLAYYNSGWRADESVILVLACVEKAQDHDAVTAAIRAVYFPWVEESARYLQNIADRTGYPGGDIAKSRETQYPDDECILFVDGLRLDLAKRVSEMLAAAGYDVEERTVWSALPTVTATGKPAVTPVRKAIAGKDASVDFEPCVAGTGQSLKGGQHLRKMMIAAGWEVLGGTETGSGRGHAWTEFGDIDREGHDRGAKIVKSIDGILSEVFSRVVNLLEAGWKRVRVVTDHGWLLLPGGLPKSELPADLVENKWGRCAALKPGASTKNRLFPWYWNPDQYFVLSDGISCFKKGQEYAHGGLSLQECLGLELMVTEGKPAKKDASAQFAEIAWKGLRCVLSVDGEDPTLTVDIRKQPGDPSSSVVMATKTLKEDGTASLLVEEENLEGTEAAIVLLDAQGHLVAQVETVIGGGNK